MARRLHRGLAAASLACGLALPVPASDLSGTWIGTIPKEGRRAARDVTFRLVQDGESLAGKAYNDTGTSDAIITGLVADGKVSFDVEALEQSGNQINIVLYEFRGRVEGSAIELTREKAAAHNAASGAEVPVRRAWDSDEEDRKRRFLSFSLERLAR